METKIGLGKRSLNALGNFLLFSSVGLLFALIITVVFKVVLINGVALEIMPFDHFMVVANINEFFWFITVTIITAFAAVKTSDKNAFKELFGDFFDIF